MFKAFTLDGRYLATYAVEGSEGAEPLSVARCLVYYVPGVVVWKGRRIAALDFFLSTYGVVIGRRVVGDAELNPPSEPEHVLLDKYICNKEVAHIETRWRCSCQNIGGQRWVCVSPFKGPIAAF